ncbi:helix-turn-helix transcriptional regulator [Aeromicrobium wangtongii]|uniref:helix-turn-helix transcriptional regulator n=1 Tax=Aeromicrobium wangtongii TaxID=2969247 RepID=UPI002017FE4F|nr:helix-turn-helix transcriptional regulator [Aeromicrobium wangtongii]MCL3819376.1 helix-turn-helix domain-containing protein [Aeromicrobium wangtongii]
MLTTSLLLRARRAAGLSQRELALRAGTSRPTLSAYEHGRKSPSLATASRIVAAAGFDLGLTPRIVFTEHAVGRGRTLSVPSRLPRLDADVAFAAVELPLHLNWSDRGRIFDLRNRRQRARVYELVLREGRPEDLLAYVDGLLLMDLWDELVLPADVRAAWSPDVARESDRVVA